MSFTGVESMWRDLDTERGPFHLAYYNIDTDSMTVCDTEASDCIYGENDTSLQHTAQYIQTQRGQDELVSTANLAAKNYALTGGWGGNVDGPQASIDVAGSTAPFITLGKSTGLDLCSRKFADYIWTRPQVPVPKHQ